MKKETNILRIQVITFFVICIVVFANNNFGGYKIQNWQVEINNKNWHISQDAMLSIQKLNIRNINDEVIYEKLLVKSAVKKGIPEDKLRNDLKISDEQGPEEKLPVYILMGKKDGTPIFVIFYKYKINNLWAVIINVDNGEVIKSINANPM